MNSPSVEASERWAPAAAAALASLERVTQVSEFPSRAALIGVTDAPKLFPGFAGQALPSLFSWRASLEPIHPLAPTSSLIRAYSAHGPADKDEEALAPRPEDA